jgi:putative glutamine amidotransferase
MKQRPLILISPSIEKKGEEFGDLSTSLSETYQQAVLGAAGLPLGLPATTDRRAISECVRRSDGVLLTGGEDLDPRLYRDGLEPKLSRTVTLTGDGGQRDLRELILIDEVFRQKKPLLAICRGHQVLNVALGGTLVVDIRAEVPQSLNHRRLDRRSEVVHEVRVAQGSFLAKVAGTRDLGVNSTHHQAVGRAAPSLTVNARSEDGVVEGLELRAESAGALPFLLSVQFHPERLCDRYPRHQAIFEAFTEACRGRNRA